MKCFLGHPAPRGYLRRFADAEGGNVAIVFAAGIVVLMLAIGAAVDVGRWMHARSQTVAAIDAAVLAGGRALQVNSSDTAAAVDAADKYYKQNVTSRLAVIDDTVKFAVASDGMGITASGSAYIKTPFLQFANVDKLPLIGNAQTQFAKSQIAVGGNGGQSVEVSLILDITGSMAGSKIAALKAAATDLVNIVIWEDQSEYTSKVALVPYSVGVNLGSTLATTARGDVKSGKKTTPGYQQYTFTNASNKSTTFSVSTCATERTGTYAYTEDTPSTAKVGLNYPSTSNPCPTAKLVPLTSDKATLTSAIDAYAAKGSTAGQIGLAWGWYTLSPKWSNIFTGISAPQSYSKLTEIGPKGQPLLKKIAVLMTDGDFNTAYCNGVISKDSDDGGAGAATDRINCNATNGDPFAQAKKLCTAMKNTGITVYTVGFNVANLNAAKTLMSQCATDSTKVYLAEDAEALRSAFRDIALKLSSLYISK